MEVILRDDVSKLGTRGQIVKVSPGYARNFLIPRKLAVPATDANKKIIEQERHAHLRREAKLSSEAAELGRMLSGVAVTIRQKAGEHDQLFGSVTAADISTALEKQGFTVDRRKIHLDENIKQLGQYKVALKLHPEVGCEVTVLVEKEE